MSEARVHSDRVAELRAAFDRSFSEAVLPQGAPLEDLLDIRVGTTAYALRISEMSGLFVDVKITPMPTPIAELIGIWGFRGSILPVYDLRAMLGYPMDRSARWLAIAAAAPVGFAFDRFEGHARVRRDAIVPQDGHDGGSRHVRDVVQVNGVLRPVLSVGSILESVMSRVRAGALEKE